MQIVIESSSIKRKKILDEALCAAHQHNIAEKHMLRKWKNKKHANGENSRYQLPVCGREFLAISESSAILSKSYTLRGETPGL